MLRRKLMMAAVCGALVASAGSAWADTLTLTGTVRDFKRGDMSGGHPDFETVNVDPRWHAYLDSKIKGTRMTHRAISEDALNRFDSQVVIEQLQAFKDSIGAGEPPTTPARPKPSLQSQVAPSSSRASTPSNASGQRIWTGKEYIDALDHRNGQRMERAEYEALIAEAETALVEGRVRF